MYINICISYDVYIECKEYNNHDTVNKDVYKYI